LWLVGLFQLALAAVVFAHGPESHGAGSVGHVNGSFMNAGDLRIGYSMQYIKWDVIDPLEAVLMHRQGKHVHDFSREWNYNVGLTYAATNDLEISAQIGYRDLRSVFVDDVRPAFVGSHDRDSSGIGDTELGVRWRLLRDPLDVYVLAEVGIPTGETHEKDLLGRRFEPEFQPGSGGWSTNLGFGVAKAWGSFSARFEAAHTLHFEGERDYEFGDSTNLRFGTFYCLTLPQPWPAIVFSSDWLAQFNEPDIDRGEVLGGHRAKLLYWIPGISFEPMRGLSVSVTAPLPVHQHWVQHQELDYVVQLSVSYTFPLTGDKHEHDDEHDHDPDE
jgi:hypothetical protein